MDIGRSDMLWETLLCTRKISIRFELLEEKGKFWEEGSKWVQEEFKDLSDKWNLQKGRRQYFFCLFLCGLSNSKTADTYWSILVGELPAVWFVWRHSLSSLNCTAYTLFYRIYLSGAGIAIGDSCVSWTLRKFWAIFCTWLVFLLWTMLPSWNLNVPFQL